MNPAKSPWHFLEQYGSPNVDWCEAGLNSWITEPANTWSNFAFILVAIIIWKPSRASRDPLLRLFAPAVLALGLFSGLYHASSTLAFQILDFLSMFLVFLIPLFLNFRALGARPELAGPRAYVLTSILATATLPIWIWANVPIQASIGLLVFLILATEARLKRKLYRNFFLGLASFGLAATASALDVSRIYCDPHDHIVQGHAIWHLLCAVGIYFCFQYYNQHLADNFAGHTSRKEVGQL
jgi:hypothetical protein